jgi:hypothetical protein
LSVNLFSNNTTFNGVRAHALDCNAMPPSANADGHDPPLTSATEKACCRPQFRAGSSPPAGQPEPRFWISTFSEVAGIWPRARSSSGAFTCDSHAGKLHLRRGAHFTRSTGSSRSRLRTFTTVTNTVPNGTSTATRF